MNLYGYDLAGQLTNEVDSTNTLANAMTNAWQYDEAGNWLNANTTNKWIYDPDNELTGLANTSDTNWSVTVTGYVEPGAQSNKWYNTWAACRGVNGRVGTNTGKGVKL